jgi:hypothetical protein
MLHGKPEFESTIPENIFRGNNPDMAKYAKKALDEKGQDALRSELFRRIDEAAEIVAEGGKSKGKIFSPLKAATAIDDHSEFIKEFLPADKQKEIFALRDGMRVMERAGHTMERYTTGKYLAQKDALTTLAGWVQMGPMKLYTTISNSPAGKAFLLKASKLSPQSPEFNKLFTEQLPKLVGAAAGRPKSMLESLGIEELQEPQKKRNMLTGAN